MKKNSTKLYTVYVLRSQRTGKLYKGTTGNLNKRLEEHKKGKVTSTKSLRPLELIFTKTFKYRQNAYQYEKFLKSGRGRSYLKKLLLTGEWRNWQTRTA
ncbi:MAG: GIY-YIG nuclease family protein [Endomicrobiia bacterium]